MSASDSAAGAGGAGAGSGSGSATQSAKASTLSLMDEKLGPDEARQKWIENQEFILNTEWVRELQQRKKMVTFTLSDGTQNKEGLDALDAHYSARLLSFKRAKELAEERATEIKTIVAAVFPDGSNMLNLTAREMIGILEQTWQRDVQESVSLTDRLFTPFLGGFGARQNKQAPGFMEAAVSEGPLAYELGHRG